MGNRKKRTLLIDADVLAYKYSLKHEHPIKWDEDLWTLHAHEVEARDELDNFVVSLQEKLNADAVVMALSDTDNWRYDVLPSYKQTRRDNRKPLCLFALKDYIRETYDSKQVEKLEGDDVLGILATKPGAVKGEKVIVTIDKDLSTIPGLHYRLNDTEAGIFEVTEESADFFHYMQALAGDPTDGYAGCPGIGMGTARKVLENPRRLERTSRIVTRGKRKGEEEVKWVEGEACSLWEAIVARYEKMGMDEQDALQQARVARILRHGDYDYKKREVKLWQPPQ